MSAGDVSRLVTLAGRFLRTMQLEDGLFCEERVRGDAHPHGRSLRYSLMTYIGLAKAGAAVDGVAGSAFFCGAVVDGDVTGAFF